MSDRFDVVREQMRRQIDEGIRPSIQVAIDWQGELVFDEAIGIDATPDSNYTLWSCTKPLIAVALLQIIEEGLRYELGGNADVYFEPAGVRAEISFS